MDLCPSRESLQRAVAGTLSPDRQQILERHLETCADCRQRLEFATDSGRVIPRGSSFLSDRLPTDALQRAMDALSDSGNPSGPAARISLAESWGQQRPPFLQPSELPGFLGKLGAYEIRRLIGRGGRGLVFEGLDPVLKRTVAIKLLSPITALSVDDRSRFLREAQAAAALAHEHIVAIHCVDEVQGMPFLVLQYIDGESLDDRLRRHGRLPFAEVVRIGAEVARGLAVAHAKGLIHRDIKPGNILLEQETGRTKITDFGLAKNLGEATLTVEGTVAGTPEFMSPEQASSGTVDARTDLFSLGVVLYTAASGTSPFAAASPLLALDRVRQHTPRPLQQVDPSLPAWFCGIVGRLLAKDPRDRIESANVVADLLERSAAPPLPGKRGRNAARMRLAAMLTGLALLAAAASVIYLHRPQPPAVGPGTNPAQAPTPTPTPTPTPEGGFVLQGQTTVFSGLGETIAAARKGDVIEVYGNGPYLTPPLTVASKPLTIRAMAGAQPVFVAESSRVRATQPFLQTDSELRLEGLTIHWSVDAPMAFTSDREMLSRCVIGSNRGRIALDHCRIVALRTSVCLGVAGQDVVLNNCQLLSEQGVGLFWRPPSGGRLTADNSVLETRTGLIIMTAVETAKPVPASVVLTHNTFAGEKSIQFALFPGQRKQPLEITARGNLFDNTHHCALIGIRFRNRMETPNAEELIAGVREIAKWSDQDNVHRRGAHYLVSLRSTAFYSAEIASVAGWLELWNLPPGQSIEGSIRFHKRESDAGTEPLRLERVEEQSGPVPARVGADPDRVGPGRAYHAR